MTSIKLDDKRLLHFFQDEKVVNDSIENFEAVFPNENLFVVLTSSGRPKYVSMHANTLFLTYSSPLLKQIIKSNSVFEEVICHSMWYKLARIIKKLNHPNITWVIWGADLYETLLYRKGYNLYTDEATLMKVRAQKIPLFIYKFLIGIRDYFYYKTSKEAADKVRNIVCPETTHKIITKYYPEYSNLNLKNLFYYPIEKMLDDKTIEKFVCGSDIWVNNAATYNGNHVDIIKKISKFNVISKVHVPLSYGMPKYAKYVDVEGSKLLGDSYAPIHTFVPKNEYYSYFLSSNSFIFGHKRACALGNIIIALYLGAKVFLDRANPLYEVLLGEGIALYNIDEELTEENVYTPLSMDKRKNNRSIILKNYSYSNLIQVIKDNFSV